MSENTQDRAAWASPSAEEIVVDVGIVDLRRADHIDAEDTETPIAWGAALAADGIAFRRMSGTLPDAYESITVAAEAVALAEALKRTSRYDCDRYRVRGVSAGAVEYVRDSNFDGEIVEREDDALLVDTDHIARRVGPSSRVGPQG